MKKNWRQTLAVATAVATASAGVLAMSVAPTQAATTTNNKVDFEGGAFGTYVNTGPVGLQSSRTAHTYISCTRQVGYKVNRSIAGVLEESGILAISGVANETRSYRTGDGSVGMISTSKVAGIDLGDLSTLGLNIGALSTYAKAWEDKDGKLHAESANSPVKIEANTGTPLDDVLNQATDGLATLIKTIKEGLEGVAGVPGKYIEIPGLGRIYLGSTYLDVPQAGKGAYARAAAESLRIRLFGPDASFAGGDDLSIVVGRSRARVDRIVRQGYFRGYGIGADVNVGDVEDKPVVKVGPLGEQRLECRGTNGEIRTNSVAGLDLADQGLLQVGAAVGRVYGKNNADGTATAWGEGRVAGIHLGSGDTSIDLDAIVGRATAQRDAKGRVIARSSGGTKIGSLKIGGEEYEIPAAGQTLEIPGVAKLEFVVKELPNTRDIRTVAVRITLLDGSPLDSVVRLGAAGVGFRQG